MNADWYPPGLRPEGDLETLTTPSGAAFQRTRFTPEAALRVRTALQAASGAQRRLSVERILAALDRTHARLSDAALPSIAEPVARATGYAPTAVSRSLQGLFRSLRREDLEGWFVASGIRPGWLDGQLDEAGTLVMGPRLTLVVSSGNVPGAALASVVQALLLKSPVLVKTASAEPALLPLYAAVLAEEDPEVAAGLVVTGWPGGDEAVEARLLPHVDALIAYGADETLASLRSRLPAHARFIGYGHRVSLTAVARECPAGDELAQGLAADACFFDQQGCLSPQVVFVEAGGDGLERLAERIAAALDEYRIQMPRSALDAGHAAAIHQYRAAAQMRGASVWASPGGSEWTVAVEWGRDWISGPGHRTVILREIADLAELPARLAMLAPALISCGIAAPEERCATLIPALAGVGITRFTGVGRAQTPTDLLHHDGVSALAALARFIRVE